MGEYYEVTTTEITKHYSVGGQRVAVRENGTLTYLLGDHLGGTSAVVNTTGQKLAESWYLPFGELRYTSGTLPTGYTYTGQFDNTADFGWMYYKARWYDPTLGRFGQADSVVPGAGDPRAWDRFSYVKNNPLGYSDPSGHFPWYYLLIGLYVIGTQVIDQISDYNAWKSQQEPYIPQPTGYPTNTGTPEPLSIKALPKDTTTPSPTSTSTNTKININDTFKSAVEIAFGPSSAFDPKITDLLPGPVAPGLVFVDKSLSLAYQTYLGICQAKDDIEKYYNNQEMTLTARPRDPQSASKPTPTLTITPRPTITPQPYVTPTIYMNGLLHR